MMRVRHTRYDQASKRLAEAERTASDQAVMIAGLQQQLPRAPGGHHHHPAFRAEEPGL